MNENLPSILNYIIAILAILYGLSRLNKKATNEPNFSFNGINSKDLKTIAYVAIGIFVLLIFVKLFSL